MYKSTSKKKTGHIISWVCGFLFAIFSVLYLYYMQADLLATAQHVLSGGKTVYSPVWGTVVLTAMLLLLQGLCHKLLDFPMRFYALGYFPSCLVLGLITSVVPAGEGGAFLHSTIAVAMSGGVDSAVAATLSEGTQVTADVRRALTGDTAGAVGTRAYTDAVIAHLG